MSGRRSRSGYYTAGGRSSASVTRIRQDEGP